MKTGDEGRLDITSQRLALFPDGSAVDAEGELWIGGCQMSALADEFGTPLYVYDELELRARCRTYVEALGREYQGAGKVTYAGKAGLNTALVQLFAQEGLGLDVVSGGELSLALRVGLDPERVHFHGNNKTPDELVMALDAGVGRVVVDGFDEMDRLEKLATERGITVPVWLRLSPNVDVDTHVYRKTGLLDSKFGFPVATGDAERAVVRSVASPVLRSLGLHCHIGSQVLEPQPFAEAVAGLVGFAAHMQEVCEFELDELSPGGGLGITYSEGDATTPIEQFVRTLGLAVEEACRRHRLALPTLVLEPGRSLTGPAAVALYRVGTRKEIPGVRIYISVDGGMADNIRPALYGAKYTALVPGRANQPATETVTIAGKYCESGDILIRDIVLQKLMPGDLLAVPAVGAYGLSLASNYNMAMRPAVVLVKGGRAGLIQRRETLKDLVRRDLSLPPWAEQETSTNPKLDSQAN